MGNELVKVSEVMVKNRKKVITFLRFRFRCTGASPLISYLPDLIILEKWWAGGGQGNWRRRLEVIRGT